MKKFLLVLILTVTAVLSAIILTACNADADAQYSLNTVYGINRVSEKYLGSVPRTLPETADGGLKRYPQYNKVLANASADEKENILTENRELFNYDKIDKDGNLYKNGEPLNKKLTKHTAAAGLYGSEIPDDAPACAKRIRITPHDIGNNMTGLYAAPGEIVTIIMNETDAERKMFVDIGQCNARQGGNNIPVTKDFTRMPILKTALRLIETVNYIGSPLGGPIYIRNEGGSLEPYEITIIGAIEMPRYFHAFTTDEEWESIKNAPAPLFDMEIYPGIRFSMPSYVIRDKSTSDMRNISDFWYKAMCLSNKVSNGAWFKDHPVTMLFDTYIPAGAAVAIVGADCCMLPLGWAKSSMNYDSIYKSGAWGTLHEFNHHHQGWGADAGGEVTNNVINALTYMLYTDIAASRTENGGLSGWNWVSDYYTTLKKVLNAADKDGANTSLETYVTLAHAFGSDAIVEAAQNSTAKTHTAWYNAAVNATGFDMTYYMRDICGLTIDDNAVAAVKQKNLPAFIPVASLYQCGVVNPLNNETIITGRPFAIPFGKPKELDFAKNIACPDGYSYEITGIDKPEYGELTKINDLTYTYTPDKRVLKTDRFYLHLKLTEQSSGNTVNASLLLAFKQNADGSSGSIWNNPGYSDLSTAIADNFETRLDPIDEIESDGAGVSDKRHNTIVKIEGQIAVPSGGEYEIFIKGSGSAVLYTGENKNSLTLSASIDGALENYSRANASSHFKIKLSADKPLYYRMYLLNDASKAQCHIGWSDASQSEGAPPITDDGEISDSAAETAPIVDIPKAYIKRYDADISSQETPVYTNKYAPEFKTDGSIFIDKSQIKITAPPQYGNSTPELMIDGDKSTFMHTKVGIDFPAVLTFDLGGEHSINSMRFTSRPDKARGRIKNYVLYGGLSPIDMRVLTSGTAVNAYTNILKFDTAQVRYLKMEITDYYGGEKYIAVSEIDFGISTVNAEIVANTNSAVKYRGEWENNTFGTFMNGALKESDNGIVTYEFYGTDAAVFAALGRKYGTAEIKIDDGEWISVNLYSETAEYGKCVYTTGELKETRHTLSMRAKDGVINIDYFAVNAAEPPVRTGLGLWWIAIAFAVITVIAAAVVCVIAAIGKKRRLLPPTDGDSVKSAQKSTDNPKNNKIKFTFRNEDSVINSINESELNKQTKNSDNVISNNPEKINENNEILINKSASNNRKPNENRGITEKYDDFNTDVKTKSNSKNIKTVNKNDSGKSANSIARKNDTNKPIDNKMTTELKSSIESDTEIAGNESMAAITPVKTKKNPAIKATDTKSMTDTKSKNLTTKTTENISVNNKSNAPAQKNSKTKVNTSAKDNNVNATQKGSNINAVKKSSDAADKTQATGNKKIKNAKTIDSAAANDNNENIKISKSVTATETARKNKAADKSSDKGLPDKNNNLSDSKTNGSKKTNSAAAKSKTAVKKSATNKSIDVGVNSNSGDSKTIKGGKI